MRIDPTHYRQLFFAEAAEHLASLEAVLMQLEASPGNRDAVADAFRMAHSVKGAADAVGFPEVARFTHRIEEVLGKLRDDPKDVPASLIDVLLQATDHLSDLVKSAQSGGPIPDGTDEMVAKLAGGQQKAGPPAQLPVAPSTTAIYSILVKPAIEALKCGLDPLQLFGDLSEKGKILSIKLDKSGLPPLADLDPEQCYLSWTIRIETDQSPSDLNDVFAFAAHAIDVTIEFERFPDSITPIAEDRVRLDPLWFGCFLCDRGVLTADQLGAALDHLRRTLPLLGVMAIQEGLLTPEQMTTVLGSMESGERFGEAAVRIGVLAEGDLWQLHLLHQDLMPALGTALLELGLIDPTRLTSEEAAFADSLSKPAEVPAPHEIDRSAAAHALPITLDYSALAENAEMIAEFCTEADDHLLAADRNLLELHSDATNKRAVDAIYRGFHTIKGVSSMLGLKAVQGLAHEAENLLNLARDGKLLLQGRPLDMAFAATDGLKRQFGFVRDWLQHRGQMELDPIFEQLLADLQSTSTGEPIAARPAPRIAETAVPAPVVDLPTTVPAPSVTAPVAPKVHVATPAVASPATPPTHRAATAEKETVRVDRDRLDKLINTIGELVIAQAMAEEEVAAVIRRAGGQMRAMGELTKISRSLQELGLSLRMVPVSGVFQKMSRLVRDLSRKMEKAVELELHGEETELDKTVVDHLGDPLMHMVRNAIDHGLESPDERKAAGKPATGHVTLKAFHQGGNVYIELSDDGKGLDRDKLLKKAIEKGIVAENARLSDSEIYALIFEAGFSTAKAVTDVSGRGVGMDVVRRNVEELHGSILIRTELGKGTTFTIRLPLTLAIMDGLMVGLGGDVYLLPLLSVIESLRPMKSDLHQLVGRGEIVSVRGEPIPLLRLHELLGLEVQVTDPSMGLVVLVENQSKKYALLVDDLLGQMQAVVKSLDTNYGSVEGLTGATILGDGRVAMILDVHGLTKLHAQMSGNWRPAPRIPSEINDLIGATL